MTSNPTKSSFHTDRSRLIKDKLAQLSISAGGVMVLVALLMIFFYLLYVVQPIFESAEVHKRGEFTLEEQGKVAALGMEEQTEIAYVLMNSGEVSFYQAKGEALGKKLSSLPVDTSKTPISFAKSAPHLGLYAYGYADGHIAILKPAFNVTFPGNKRVITPEIRYPLGNTQFLVDEQSQGIKLFAFSRTEESVAALALTDDRRVVFASFVAEENFMTDEIEWVPSYSELDIEGRVDELLLSPDNTRAFVRSANQIYIFNTRDPEEVELIQVLAANAENANLVTSSLLAGANSLMLANDNGEVSQWFEVNSDQGREFKKIRTFDTQDKQIVGVYPEYFRRSFFTVNKSGDLGVYYTTS